MTSPAIVATSFPASATRCGSIIGSGSASEMWRISLPSGVSPSATRPFARGVTGSACSTRAGPAHRLAHAAIRVYLERIGEVPEQQVAAEPRRPGSMPAAPFAWNSLHTAVSAGFGASKWGGFRRQNRAVSRPDPPSVGGCPGSAQPRTTEPGARDDHLASAATSPRTRLASSTPLPTQPRASSSPRAGIGRHNCGSKLLIAYTAFDSFLPAVLPGRDFGTWEAVIPVVPEYPGIWVSPSLR